MYGKIQVSGLTKFIPFISYAPQLSETKNVCLFTLLLASLQLLSNHHGVVMVAALAGSQFWEPLFTFGDQK